VVEVVVVRHDRRFLKQLCKALRVLYEYTEDNRDYFMPNLVRLLRCHGIRRYAWSFTMDFKVKGLLKCDSQGFCKVDKTRVKELLEEYEAKLARSKARARARGGGSGPQG
jgi:ATPase subunit of ABC transporter with duplicated ATPase domains